MRLKNKKLMKVSDKCKLAGLKNLVELSEMTGRTSGTLIRWANTDPVFFDIVLRGVVSKKNCEALNKINEKKKHD